MTITIFVKTVWNQIVLLYKNTNECMNSVIYANRADIIEISMISALFVMFMCDIKARLRRLPSYRRFLRTDVCSS